MDFAGLFQFAPNAMALCCKRCATSLWYQKSGNAQGFLERLELITPIAAKASAFADQVGSCNKGDKSLSISQFE
jgi:hypothetical protein